MKKKNLLVLIISTVFLMVFSIVLSTNNVFAAAIPDTKTIYQVAPDGMKIKDYLGKTNTFSGKSTVSNNAKFIYAGDATYQNPTDIVQLMSASGSELGSFWGSYDDSSVKRVGNYFDLSKKQTVAVWFYNGNSDTSPTDGFAFVLQNDPNSYDAISRYNGSPKSGETIGVWGGTNAPKIATTNVNPFSNAIQNSVALEFDTISNNIIPTSSSGSDNSFDMLNKGNDLKNNHISWGYPAESATYTNHELTEGLGVFARKYYYTEMNHKETFAKQSYLAGFDGEDSSIPKNGWRHLVINYEPVDYPNTGRISFGINDKYSDGTLKGFTAWDKGSFDVDLSKLNPTAHDGKVLWGFTSATGSSGHIGTASATSSKQDVGMVMEAMPMIANITATVTMTDLTANYEVPDLDKALSGATNSQKEAIKLASTVYNNDQLRLDYDLKFDSGMADTGAITTKVGLPQNVNFTPVDGSDRIGLITYTDKDGNKKTVDITTDQLTTMVNNNGKTINGLNLTLNSMSSTNDTAKMEIFGQAQAPTNSTVANTTVDGEHTSYRSDEYNGDVMTPQFIINNESLRIAATGQVTQTIPYTGNATLTGDIDYVLGSTFNGDSLTAYATVDDKTEQYVKTGINVSKGATKGSFNLTDLTGTMLTPGEHTVHVHLIDSLRRVSNTVDYKVIVEDYKKLLITQGESTIAFNTTKLTQLTATLKYDNSDQVKPADITIYASVDGGEYQAQKVNGDPSTSLNVSYGIEPNSLSDSPHIVKLYADDGVRKSDTVTYSLTTKMLTATPSEDTENITVNDNKPVTIKGTYAYSDGSDIADSRGALVTYTIKNEDYEAQKSVSEYFKNDDKSFEFTLKPIAYDRTIQPIEDWLASDKAVGLREGRNEITVTVSDGKSYSSTPIVFLINVPKIDLKISTNNPNSSIISVSTSALINLPMSVEYVGYQKYILGKRELKFDSKLDSSNIFKTSTGNWPDKDTTTPVETIPYTTTSILGITDLSIPGPYGVNVRVIDPYARVSNVLTYSLKILQELLELDVDDYSFKPINYGQPAQLSDYVRRDGKWKVNVKSFKSDWKLMAQQNDDFYQDNGDGTSSKMVASMVYYKNNMVKSLLNQNVEIAAQDTASPNLKTIDVSSDWEDDEGILLRVNDYSKAGTYKGKINWTLVDSAL